MSQTAHLHNQAGAIRLQFNDSASDRGFSKNRVTAYLNQSVLVVSSLANGF